MRPAPWYHWVLVFLFEFGKYTAWGSLVWWGAAFFFRYRVRPRVFFATVAIVALLFTPQGVEDLRYYIQQKHILMWGETNIPGGITGVHQTEFRAQNVHWTDQIGDWRFALYDFLNPFKPYELGWRYH